MFLVNQILLFFFNVGFNMDSLSNFIFPPLCIVFLLAPPNADNFRLIGQNETSVSLQWSKVKNNNFNLQFNGTTINITAPDGNGPVTHTVSDLAAGTQITFTLFTVFENIRSSGVKLTAVTGETINMITLWLTNHKTLPVFMT